MQPPSTHSSLFALLVLLAGCGDSNEQISTSSSSSSSSSGGGGGALSSSSDSTGTGSASGGGGGAPAAAVVSKLSASSQSSSEHEPQLVLGASGRIVTSWVDLNFDANDIYHVAYRISDDGGVTWGEITSIPLPEDNNIASNTTLAAAADGTIYLAWASEYEDMSGVRTNQGVYLATLAPSDGAFGEPQQLTDPSVKVGVYDQPSVTVTPSGALLVTFGEGDLSLANAWLVMMRSEDAGATWTTSVPLQDDGPGTYQNLAHPCAPASGKNVYVYYSDGKLGLTLWPSKDDGKTFDPADRVVVQGEDESKDYSTLLDGNCVADGSDVWIIYGLTDQPAAHVNVPRLTHVAIAHSSDGGTSFDWRSHAEDPATGPYYLLPRIAREPGGKVDITYYSGTGQNDAKAFYREARSADGGQTFAPSQVVYSPVDYQLSRSTEQWLGDYMGLKAAQGKLYGVFVDNSDPKAHALFFQQTLE